MARPLKPINAEEVEKLAAINCSVEEVADWFGVSRGTIKRRFGPVLKKGRSKGKTSLKRKMFETAMGGNVTMMIWLSKQMLSYTDKVEQKNETQMDAKVTYEAVLGSDIHFSSQDTQTLQSTPKTTGIPSIES